MTWKAIYNWNDLELLAIRALHAMFCQVPFFVPPMPCLLPLVVHQIGLIESPAPTIQTFPYQIRTSCLRVPCSPLFYDVTDMMQTLDDGHWVDTIANSI